MLQKYKNIFKKSSFQINGLSVFQHSYLMRKAIYKGINDNKNFLSGKILDFGCGEKPYQNIFKYESYTGVDFKNSGHDNSQNQVDYFWDGITLPFESNNFDSILATEVFEHIFNIDEVLIELHRVLRQGGYIVITIPFIIHEHEIPYDFARYTHYGIADVFSRHGFDIVENKQYGNYADVIAQLTIWFFGKLSVSRFRYITLFFRIIFIAPLLLTLNLLSFIFPKMQSGMYLSTTLVGKKR